MDSSFPTALLPLINGVIELASVVTNRIRLDHDEVIYRQDRTSAASKTKPETSSLDELMHLQQLSSRLNTMRKNSVLTDVTLMCGCQPFDAHRNILAAACPFFESAFTKGWTTSSQINLPNISADSMDAILSYIYMHKLTEIIGDKEAMMKLLEDAVYLQMDDLVKFAYRSFAELHLKTSNFHHICLFLDGLNSEYCRSEITAFLAKNFCEIAKSNDFLLLTAGQLENVLKHPELDKSSMNQIFNHVLKWAECDIGREEIALKLLDILGEWCSACLDDIVHKNISPKLNYRIVDILVDFSAHNTCRKSVPTVEAVACIMENRGKRCYHLATLNEDCAWNVSKELPTNLTKHGAAAIMYGSHMFVLGGQPLWPDSPITSNNVTTFCPLTHTILSSEDSLCAPVAKAGIGILNDVIYLVNGVDNDGRCLTLVQRYNPKEGTCHLSTSTNYGHCCPLVCSINNKLFIVSSGKDDGNLLECYDAITDQWTVVSTIPGSFYGCNAVTCGSEIFILKYNEFSPSGDQYESQFHVYDAVSNVWEVKPFENGPSTAWDMVSCKVQGEQAIFTVDCNGRWKKFMVSSCKWTTPVLNYDEISWFVLNTFTFRK